MYPPSRRLFDRVLWPTFLQTMVLAPLLVTPARGSEKTALSMVPLGKLFERTGREYGVKTKAGSKIYLEFSLDGKFQEARGRNLNHGDEFEPGDGLLSLSSAAQLLRRAGQHPESFWELEHDTTLGWVYQFSTAVVDAKTGKVRQTLVGETLSPPD